MLSDTYLLHVVSGRYVCYMNSLVGPDAIPMTPDVWRALYVRWLDGGCVTESSYMSVITPAMRSSFSHEYPNGVKMLVDTGRIVKMMNSRGTVHLVARPDSTDWANDVLRLSGIYHLVPASGAFVKISADDMVLECGKTRTSQTSYDVLDPRIRSNCVGIVRGALISYGDLEALTIFETLMARASFGEVHITPAATVVDLPSEVAEAAIAPSVSVLPSDTLVPSVSEEAIVPSTPSE